jgi:hypothetical protein
MFELIVKYFALGRDFELQYNSNEDAAQATGQP